MKNIDMIARATVTKIDIDETMERIAIELRRYGTIVEDTRAGRAMLSVILFSTTLVRNTE